MAGKFSLPRFPQEDLDATQELPQLPDEFEPIGEDPIPDYDYHLEEASQPEYQPEYSGEYDPEEELPEDFIDVALRILKDLPGFFVQHKTKFLLGACALILVVLIGFIGSFAFQTRDPYDEKILNNLVVVDVLVGGMTKDQAITTLNTNLASRYTTQPMIIQLGDETIRLEPSETGAKLNVQAAVEAAYAFGRTGSQADKEQDYQTSLSGNYVISALPYLELDKDFIRKTLEDFETACASELTQTTYTLEGEVSSLSTEVFNPAASGQTLVITLGTPQVDFDAETLYEKVLDAYSMGQFHLTESGPVTTQEPDPIDLDAIYEEFYLEPVAPTLDMTDFTAIPGSYGRDFDLAAAKLLLADAQPGDELRIPMTYPTPEGDPTEVLYRDTLGTWSTSAPSDENWKQNMRLACKAINGVTLNPGETFSFNAVIGQPTEAQGYVAAPICGTPELGGNLGEGVCQVASTLYVAALLSELDVTSRTAHAIPMTNVERGLDADIQWGSADLIFRNSSIYPIRIEAELSGGTMNVKIIGTDMRSYRTDMAVSVSETVQPKIIYEEFSYDNAESYRDGDVIQEGRDGSQVKTYRCRYDKQSGNLVARDYIATSTYASQDKIIARVAPPVADTAPDAPDSESISGVDPGVEAVG